MRAVEAFLGQLDDAWGHQFESVESALRDVSEPEGAWQAPCYAADEQEALWPQPGTILWQVAHLAHCKRYYAALIRARGQENPSVPARLPLDSLAAEMAALDAAHEVQRAALAELSDEDLAMSVGTGMTLPEFLAMMIRHDTWHASQIMLVRRMYRTRPDA